MKLVSVIVVTFNNGSVILETLDSIYSQSYDNIELIISDDCSSDDSIKIFYNWIDKNKNRFSKIKLLTNNVNSGITNNINRALDVAQGDYIKVLGDDILTKDAIKLLVDKYEESKDEKTIWVGKMEPFSKNNFPLEDAKCFLNTCEAFLKLSQPKQQKSIIKKCTLPAPSTEFFPRNIIDKNTLYQQGIDYIEDWPCWIVLALNGYKFKKLNHVIIKYRVNNHSSTQSKSLLSFFYKAQMQIFFKLRWKLLIKNKMFFTFFKDLALFSYIRFLSFLSKCDC